jgi:hypothetical protein
MEFNYETPNERQYTGTTYRAYRYRPAEPLNPRWELVSEIRTPIRPFEDTDALARRMFEEQADRAAALDPLNFPGEKAHMQDRQIHLLMDHLAARHAISYHIRKNIDYQESNLQPMLEEVRSKAFPGGPTSKRASELEKQLLELSKERWAEEVSCWRDTSRVLGDITEHWSEYSDESRKARLMNFDV